MYNVIEEKEKSGSQNGPGLSNGLVNKEAEDTWATLNNAIDNELNNVCSNDVKRPHSNKHKDIDKLNGSNITKPVRENTDITGKISQKIIKLNNKIDKDVVDLDDSDEQNNKDSRNGDTSLEPLEERLSDEFLSDESFPITNNDSCKNITNGATKIQSNNTTQNKFCPLDQ